MAYGDIPHRSLRPALADSLWLGCAWAFILAAATHDAQFAWHNRAEMPQWEMNPLAASVVESLGVAPVLGFKFAVTAFTLGLAFYCRRYYPCWARRLTVAVCGVYLLLAAHYWMGSIPSRNPYGIPPERLQTASGQLADPLAVPR